MTWLNVAVRPGVANQTSRVQLEGVEYGIVVRWSEREARWYLDLFAANGDPLALCLKLMLLQPSLDAFRARDGIPPGELILLDPRPVRSYPTIDELGDAVQLVYVESQHVAATGGTTPPLYTWGAT